MNTYYRVLLGSALAGAIALGLTVSDAPADVSQNTPTAERAAKPKQKLKPTTKQKQKTAKQKLKKCRKGFVRRPRTVKIGKRRVGRLVCVRLRRPARRPSPKPTAPSPPPAQPAPPAAAPVDAGPSVAEVERILSDYYKIENAPPGGGPENVTITFFRPTKVGALGVLDTTPTINDAGIPAWPVAVWVHTHNGDVAQDRYRGCGSDDPRARFPGNRVAHWFYRSSAGGWEWRTNTPPSPGFCN